MIKLTGLPKKGHITSLGMGVFDGLHLGHQALVSECDYILSFHPHPDILLKKETDLQLITTKRELRTLQKKCLFLEFNRDIASLQPLEFLEKIVKNRISPKKIVVGYDFYFGYKKQGSPTFLKEWGEKNGISVLIIPPVKDGDIPIKSGLIRRYLRDGHFNQAIDYLGHPLPIIGTVIRGDGRGKDLGFPTANLKLPPLKLIPANGVYKGQAYIDKKTYQAMIYIGNKPTFKGRTQSVEVHMPGLNKTLYGKQLHITLDTLVRPEMTFTSPDELITQIKKDLTCLA